MGGISRRLLNYLRMHVQGKNSDYYNLNANLLKHRDFDKCMVEYAKAVEFAEDNVKKAKYLNNMAIAILDSRKEEWYSQGLDYCEACLKVNPKHGYVLGTIKRLKEAML